MILEKTDINIFEYNWRKIYINILLKKNIFYIKISLLYKKYCMNPIILFDEIDRNRY